MKTTVFLCIILLSSHWITASPTSRNDDAILSYSMLEKLPEFPGGDQAMNDWMEHNVVYPEKALKDGTEAILVVDFVVRSDGSICDAKVNYPDSREKMFVKEAVRLFESMPKWKPATSKGKTVNARFTKPVSFRIKNLKRDCNIVLRNPYMNWLNEPYKMSSVPKLPEYPGGSEAMYKWIADNTIYPAEAVKAKIEGKVIVEFVISETGSVEDPKIKKGVTASLDNEALRLIRSMPRWEPGYNRGNPVKTTFVVPVTFRLAKDR